MDTCPLIALLLLQSPQQFEVASIRPSLAAPSAGTSFNLFEGGRLKITNEPVKLLIRTAFQIQNAQLAGGPPWLDTDRYDIEAQTGFADKPSPDQLSPLLQSPLADRFHLKFHRETRDLTVYALVLTGTPKLRPAAVDETTAMNTNTGRETSRLAATAAFMEMLAGYVGNRQGRIVVDKTGLLGRYDFTLDWAPDQASNSSSPSLVTALREQLGLRLESQKSPV